MGKYIFRLDDIAENMDEKSYLKLKEVFLKYNIKPIIGVIPDNKDKQLLSYSKVSFDFWKEIFERQNEDNWTIALHGHIHVYETESSGMLKINQRSEFAGLSYERQMEKIQKGLNVFQDKGITTNMFMAPSHSFDKKTLKVLRESEFKFITDGYALFPYKSRGITFIPQLFSVPRKMPYGIYTWCLHLNTMTDKDIKRVENFIEENHKNIISVKESLKYKKNGLIFSVLNKVIGMTLRTLRGLKK